MKKAEGRKNRWNTSLK